MGVPTWILLSHAADWRWLLKWSDSPWYPTARLFRQTTAGEWDVMARVAAELVMVIYLETEDRASGVQR